MRYPIDTIGGVGAAFKEKLAKADVTNTSLLPAQASTPQGRKELATGIADGLIQKCANMGDLMRIKGVAGGFAELLDAAGIDIVKGLKTRKAENLHAKIVEVNEAKQLARQTPTLKAVTGWIAQAGELPAVLTS